MGATSDASPTLLDWIRKEGHDRRVGGARSVLGASYDLYYDLVVRHLDRPQAALRWLDNAGQWRELTYAQLHAQSARLAGEWLGAGLCPGDTLALVLPMGAAFAVAALTALRLGACLSVVPPDGRRAVQARLAALGPCRIVTAPRIEVWLGELAAQVLRPAAPSMTATERSVSYAPADLAGRLFSPLRGAGAEPAPITAEQTYLGALRDGGVVLGLEPGATFAAPGFDTLQHQPSLLWATFLAGATYVHLTQAQVAAAPARLWERSIDVLGVSYETRDLVLAHGKRGTWRMWFKNPEAPFDGMPWCSFVTECARDSEMRNVLVEAASGGALLASSARSPDACLPRLQNVAAAPGVAGALLNVSNPEVPALDDVGLFASHIGDDYAGPKHAIVCRSHDGEYLYAGNTGPRRVGRAYPVEDVCAVVDEMPGVDASCVVSVPSARAAFLHRFVVVVFGPAPPSAEAVKERVTFELGHDATPDDVETTRLAARRTADSTLDRAWCENQCLTGTLQRKGRVSLFGHIADLRRLLVARAE